MATTEEVNPVRGKDSENPGSLEASTSNGVKKLAALARISIDDAELEKFTSEFDAILAYVGQLESLEIPKDMSDEKPPLRNVMRGDADPYAARSFTAKIAEQFPAREGDYLVVKQIITHE